MSLERWMTVYSEELLKAVREFPTEYAYPESQVPEVLGRMRASFARNGYNITGHAIKRTCKAFGLKLTEHRESYLRNEATMFATFDYERMEVLKNPFGDRMDGTVDAGFMEGFGLGQAMPPEDKAAIREFFCMLAE